jgi:hypothetical protein
MWPFGPSHVALCGETSDKQRRGPRTPGAPASAASRELRLLAVPFGADQIHEVNRLSSNQLRVGVPLDKELTVAEVTRLAIKNVEEIFLQ